MVHAASDLGQMDWQIERSFPISLASVRHCLFPPNDLWRPFPQNQFSNSVYIYIHLQIHTNVELWQIYFSIVDLLHPNSGIHMLSQDVISHRLSPYRARMCFFAAIKSKKIRSQTAETQWGPLAICWVSQKRCPLKVPTSIQSSPPLTCLYSGDAA